MAIYEHRVIRYINLLAVCYFNKVFRRAVLSTEENKTVHCESAAMDQTIICKEKKHAQFLSDMPDVQATNDRIMTALKNQLYKNEAMAELKLLSSGENNWPPLPKVCCIRSCFYHNIEFDIPIQFQKLVYFLYYLWMFHGMVNFINLVGGIIIMDETVIIFSVFYNLFCLFYSFVGWYRCAYQAFSTRSTYYFVAFLYTFFLQFLMIVIQSLGVPNSGTLGFITALNAIPQMDNLHFMVGVIVALACCSVAILDFIAIAMISNLHMQVGAYFVQDGGENLRMKIITMK